MLGWTSQSIEGIQRIGQYSFIVLPSWVDQKRVAAVFKILKTHTHTQKMANNFKYETFPMKNYQPEYGVSSSYDCCRFTRETWLSFALFNHRFTNCYFETGSIVTIFEFIDVAEFIQCVFQPGCVIIFFSPCHDLTLDRCDFPVGEHVFKGPDFRNLSFARKSPIEILPILPPYSNLYLCDGCEKRVNWEILESFPYPRGTPVYYSNVMILKNQRSLDVLTSMSWRNPHFHIVMDHMHWQGDQKEFDAFQREHSKESTIVFVLLLVFPADLIRVELVPFLIH